MFTLSTLSAFVVIVLGLFLIPGPAVLLTAARTVQGGRKAGIMAGLGIATGDFIHTVFALFFMALLPQFVHHEQGASFFQFLILGLIFVVLSVIYTTCIAMSVRFLGRLAKRISWMGRWSGKIVGAIYIGLGLKVAFQSR